MWPHNWFNSTPYKYVDLDIFWRLLFTRRVRMCSVDGTLMIYVLPWKEANKWASVSMKGMIAHLHTVMVEACENIHGVHREHINILSEKIQLQLNLVKITYHSMFYTKNNIIAPLRSRNFELAKRNSATEFFFFNIDWFNAYIPIANDSIQNEQITIGRLDIWKINCMYTMNRWTIQPPPPLSLVWERVRVRERRERRKEK